MSRLWRDRVSIFIGADAVELTRRARWQRRVAARHLVECEGGRWPVALEALKRGLDAVRWPAADADVVVSNHFVRFAQVPHVDKLRGGEERLAAARHALRHVFGPGVEQWNLALGATTRAGSGIAAGIEREFMAGILAALQAASLQPMTIEPLLARAFNVCRKTVGRKPAWLAVAEPGRVALAHLERGRWHALRNLRLRGQVADELAMFLDQARIGEGAGGATKRVVLASIRSTTGAISLPGDWLVETVRLDNPGLAVGAGE